MLCKLKYCTDWMLGQYTTTVITVACAWTVNSYNIKPFLKIINISPKVSDINYFHKSKVHYTFVYNITLFFRISDSEWGRSKYRVIISDIVFIYSSKQNSYNFCLQRKSSLLYYLDMPKTCRDCVWRWQQWTEIRRTKS